MSEAVLEAPWLCIDAHCGARLPQGKRGGDLGPGAAVQLLITFRGGGTGRGQQEALLNWK